MSTLTKLTILSLIVMVLIYGDSYSQDRNQPGLINIRELKERLIAELKSDGFVKNGEYKITYSFSNDELKINDTIQKNSVKEKYRGIILDYYFKDTRGIFIMARPYEDGNIKGNIIGLQLEE